MGQIFLCIYVTNGDARSAIANFLVLSTFNSFDTALPSDDVVVNGKNSEKVTQYCLYYFTGITTKLFLISLLLVLQL